MKKVIDKNLCTGCTACFTICPKKAITMFEDSEGFKYPEINHEKCINCGLCKKICPVLNTTSNESINKCYVGYNKDEFSLMNKASSGSIFELIANKVLDEKGIIIGAAFDKKNKLKHIAITNKKNLEQLKGSKYIQSDLNNIFSYIKENISKKKILFVGTPCQVAGIKTIIKDNINLICIDVICHGVPSPKLFEKYIHELEKEHNTELTNYNFRDKTTGWDTYSNTAIFKDKKITDLAKNNKYMKLFLSDIALRESCYNCNFKLGNKYADITLGDFWGVQNYYKEMYNKKGVSAIIINTIKGMEIFNDIKNNLEFKSCKLDEIVSGNKSLMNSSKKRNNRNRFFEEINSNNIDYLVKKYTKVSLLTKVKLIWKNFK